MQLAPKCGEAVSWLRGCLSPLWGNKGRRLPALERRLMERQEVTLTATGLRMGPFRTCTRLLSKPQLPWAGSEGQVLPDSAGQVLPESVEASAS